MKPALTIAAVALCIAQIPLAAQDRARGRDITPVEVRQSVYKWGKPIREDRSLQARMLPPASQWMNRATSPMDGFVVLPSGERFVGKLTLHNRLTAQAERGGSTDPNADLITKIEIEHDGTTDTYTLADVSAFGARFKPSDWDRKKSKDLADSFNPGYVLLDDDTRREGFVSLSTRQVAGTPLRTFDKVYFAETATGPVDIYLTPRSARPGVPKVMEAGQQGGVGAEYRLVRGGLADQTAWIALLERDPKKLQAERLVPGEVVFDNGATLKGRIAVQSGKTKTSAFLIDEDGDLLHLVAEPGVKVIRATENGVLQHYVVLDGELVNNQEAIARFTKNETLNPGKVALASGQELVGKVSIKRVHNLVKSYRTPLGAYFLPSAEGALLSYYAPSQVEFVEEQADGATTRYAPFEATLVPLDEYLATLESGKSRDKTRNLHPGYVMLDDGTRHTGRIAQRSGGAVFVEPGNRLRSYRPSDKGLRYFVQTIDGVERRFIPLQGGVRAFSDAAMEFVEVHSADKAFSWYRNPNPTHMRKFVTGLVKGAVNTATDVGRTQLANAAAKEQVRSAMENSDKGVEAVGSAVAAGAQAQQDALNLTAGMVEVSDEGGLYHKEWVVVNNATGERTVVYSGNASAELGKLLSQCPRYATLDSRTAKRMADVDGLEAAVSFLNSCR